MAWWLYKDIRPDLDLTTADIEQMATTMVPAVAKGTIKHLLEQKA